VNALIWVGKVAAILYVVAATVSIPYLVTSESRLAARVRRALRIP
jgi:hypothetical protein